METKICTNPTCNIEKPLSDFHKQKDGRLGRVSWCKLCVKEKQQKIKIENGIPEGHRICVDCKELKHYDSFEDGKIKCEDCHNKDKSITEKLCTGECGKIKPLSDFGKSKTGILGLRADCKVCHGKKGKIWRNNNKERVKDNLNKWQENNPDKLKGYEENRKINNPNYKKEWYEKNPDYYKNYRRDHIEKIMEYEKQYYQDNKEKINKKRKIRRETDILYKLNCIIREMVHRVFNMIGTEKDGKTFELLGYSPEQLKLRLETNFKSGMNWDNYGVYWEIDHKIPIDYFLKKGVTSQKTINALCNLQPLTVNHNRSKGKKLDWNK